MSRVVDNRHLDEICDMQEDRIRALRRSNESLKDENERLKQEIVKLERWLNDERTPRER